MGQTGADKEPLHEQAGYVWDGSDWVKQPLTPTVAQSQIYGYDGSAWQKLPLLFGYTDTLAEVPQNGDLAAGINSLQGSSVPAGEIWVVTAANLLYVGTSPTYTQLSAVIGGVTLFLLFVPTPASLTTYPMQGSVVLKEDDYMAAAVAGATLHDAFYLTYAGYKMEVA